VEGQLDPELGAGAQETQGEAEGAGLVQP